MMQYVGRRNTIACTLLLLPIAGWGCKAGSPVIDRTVGSAADSSSSDVDPARAYVALADILPTATPPIRPESFTPLSERSARLIATSKKLVAEERYTEAALELERALRYDPNHPDIHRALAVLHWQAGNGERAQAHAERALSKNSDDTIAHYYVARRAAQQGDHADAIAAFRTALLCSDVRADPDLAGLCHYYLAQSLVIEGYLEAGLAQYAAYEAATIQRQDTAHPELAALQRVPGAAAGRPMASVLERLGRPGEAADVLAPVVAGSPDDGALCVRFATLLVTAGRFDEALRAIRETHSDHPDILRLLADIHVRRSTPKAWIDDLQAIRQRRPDDVQLVLELAEALGRHGRDDQVTRELEVFLRGHPEAIDVRDRLATVQARDGNWLDALQTIAVGLRTDPATEGRLGNALDAIAADPRAVADLLESPLAFPADSLGAYIRGDLAKRAGQSDQAERWLKEALRRDPGFILARVSLAKLYTRSYRYEDAIDVVARSDAEVAEDARLEGMLGELYERLDEPDKAELHFRAAVQLDRSDVASMFALADVYRRSGRVLQAQRQLRVLLEKSPSHEDARRQLALSYRNEGKTEVAIEQFEKLAELATDEAIKATVRARLSTLFTGQGFRAYREALLAVVAEHGGRPSILLDIADSYNDWTELDAQRDAYLEALRLDPESERAAVGLIGTLARLLDYEQAIARLKVLLPRRPNRHVWREQLIKFCWAVQDYETALELSEKEEKRPNLEDNVRRRYRFRILDSLRLMDRLADRLDRLESWAKQAGDESEWAARLALAYLGEGQPGKAVAILERRYLLEPDDKLALSDLVDALAAAGHHERAGQLALNWLFDDPENDHAIALLVKLLADNDRIDSADDLVRNRLLHTEYREDFQGLITRFLQQQERHDDCIEWIESLIDRVLDLLASINENRFEANAARDNKTLIRLPNEPFGRQSLFLRLTSLRLQLAQQMIIMKKYREAEMQLGGWLGSARDSRTRYAFLRRVSACRQALGEDARATDALERALAIALEDIRLAEGLPGLNNDISYSWIDRGVRLDEAEPMIRYAVSRVPQQAAYLDTYGWLQYKRANYQEAKKWLERAVGAMDNDDSVLFDHMGDTLWRLGKKEKAIEYWTSAMRVVRERGEDEFPSADSRRVRDNTQQKIDDAAAGKAPKVASLAMPVSKIEPESDNNGKPQQVN